MQCEVVDKSLCCISDFYFFDILVIFLVCIFCFSFYIITFKFKLKSEKST
uniref:Uncharacterized protein n=1 Tax=Anguilla anguilla TaxID=7936 RepID=A0A0E9V0T4_ANGAN